MTNKRPTFSLVYLTWNAEDVIEDTLSSAVSQEYQDYEIIIVDNGSQDGTTSIIKKKFERKASLRLIENDENLGFSRGINGGIRATKGDYICCYNHDTILSEGYLSALASCVTDDTVWTTARVNHRVSESHQCVRLLDSTGFSIPYVVDDLTGTYPVNYVPGDGLIVPRTIYTDNLDEELFNPVFPPRVEDVALSLQLRQRGIPIRAIVDTCSIHPDKGDRYAPTFENLKDLLETYRGRILATRMYNPSARALLLTLFSLITQPFAIYIGSFPKAEHKFRSAINQLNNNA